MPTHTHRSHSLAYSLTYSRNPPGPALLFHHGLGSNRAQGPMLLGPVPCTRICPDAPSHADSDAAPELHTFDALADAAIALLDHLAIDTAILGGLSMGAGVSLNAALRHPARVRALILVRPAWLAEPNPPNLAIIARIGRWLETEGPDAARTRLHADPLYADMLATNPNAAASLATLLDFPPARAGVLYDMVAHAPFGAMSDLARIDIPSLVISTDADPLHPTPMAHAIAAALPRAEHHATPPRYLAPAPHTAAVRALVNDFLTTNRPA